MMSIVVCPGFVVSENFAWMLSARSFIECIPMPSVSAVKVPLSVICRCILLSIVSETSACVAPEWVMTLLKASWVIR